MTKECEVAYLEWQKRQCPMYPEFVTDRQIFQAAWDAAKQSDEQNTQCKATKIP